MYYYIDKEIIAFPHPDTVKPSGILAIAGDLSINRLLLAYHFGIFPWYNEDDPIIWWCPKPRFVIYPHKVKVPKSLNSYFNQNKFRVTYNTCFSEVIKRCQVQPRKCQNGTWINNNIIRAYTSLHQLGYAMSVEVWEQDLLVGGLYGVRIEKVFFGESMFSTKSNASKFGFVTLARRLEDEGYLVIDCQQPNPYLESLGGEFLDGAVFQQILKTNRFQWLNNQ